MGGIAHQTDSFKKYKFRPLRIAQIAPIIERVPAKKYGGTERVVHTLTEELVKRGHKVTLFASGDSQTSAQLFSVYPRGLREAGVENPYDGRNMWNLLNVSVAYKNQDKFDIIHDHTVQNSPLSLPMAMSSQTPAVMTLHGALDEKNIKDFEAFNTVPLITISKAQGRFAPHLNYAGNVYNGLDMDDYPYSETHEGYLLFVGRISIQKGVHFAIEAAIKLNMPLIIAAKLDKVDIPYFEQYVKPFLTHPLIKWIGEVDETERNNLMSKAYCFLHPVTWPEPFGLTLIESMACGAPVVAFSNGSIPEIIIDGKTGFVVNSVDEMVEAVKKVPGLKRIDSKYHARINFSSENMAIGYEEAYAQVIAEKSLEKTAELARGFIRQQTIQRTKHQPFNFMPPSIKPLKKLPGKEY